MKKPNRRYVLSLRHDQFKVGAVRMDVTFLLEWLGERRAHIYGRAMTAAAAGLRSGGASYNVRSVLSLWKGMSKDGPRYLNDVANPSLIIAELHDLRRLTYESTMGDGCRVNTANNKWANFLRFLKHLVALQELPVLNYSRLLPSLPKSLHTTSAELARLGEGDPETRPKSFSMDKDAFHSGLIVPISISKTSEEYIEAYRIQLSQALSAIQNAAMDELRETLEKFESADRLINAARYPRIRATFQANRKRGPGRYTDPSNGRHFFDAADDHPHLLGNLLAMVVHEMDGIPLSRSNEVKQNGKRKTCLSAKGGGHWLFVSRYGKNRLLPYLGILTSRTMVPFFLVILLEHPSLTVSSLLGARLSNEKGTAFLINPTDGRSGKMLSIEKPRAGSFKQAELTDRSRFAFDLLMRMTKTARYEMLRQGRADEANYLWLGIHMIDYRIFRVSEKQLTNAFRTDPRFSSQRGVARSSHLTSFVDSHPTVAALSHALTLKSLRASAGVLRFINKRDDLVACARSLGHVNVQTTLDHYIPKAFQLALYEHKIRRHQNLLLALAASGETEMMRFTDFETMQDLNAFLKSQTSAIALLLATAAKGQKNHADPGSTKNRLLLHNQKHAVAIAILFAENVDRYPEHCLSAVDIATGVAPIFWKDFVTALLAPLPDALAPLRDLVKAAREHAARLRGLIRFPDVI